VLYKADVRLFDSAGNRLKVAKFERQNNFFGVVSEIRLPDADNDRAEVISVKKHGPAWRLLSGDEVETDLNGWQKSVDELQETMSKLGNALSKKSVKASSRKKTKRTTPR
jgi:hypothetical protein